MIRRVACALACAIALACPAELARAEPDAGAPEASGDAGGFPILQDDGRPSPQTDALVLVVEGLEGVIAPATLRARLSSVFSRPVIALSDAQAESARATLWLAADAQQVTLRLSTPPRPDLWQRIARAKLGPDPVATLVNTLLDMLWSERMKPAPEMRNPFCPPGSACDAEADAPAQRAHEQAVLDPWDPAYARFDRAGHESARGEDWTNAPPARAEVQPAAPQVAPPKLAPSAPRWAVAALVGGGVHQGGGFARYEINGLRRFARFDVGLTYIGGRGQPDAARARRSLAAQAQYRFILDGVEIDVGGSFGIFFAERYAAVDVRPYLRATGAFAIDTRSPVAVLIQTELGTTFWDVGDTGLIEYALSLGARYGF